MEFPDGRSGGRVRSRQKIIAPPFTGDLRVVTIDVARQEVMTRDNVPMTVDAVVYFRVIDPAAAVVRVELPESDFAHFADNVAQRARTSGTR